MLEARIDKRLGTFALGVEVASRGRVTGLFGPSGSGKTTFLGAVAGIIRPDAGRIGFSGSVWFDGAARVHVPARRRRIGYVFQDPLLFEHMDVRRNIVYGRRRGGGGPDFDEVVEVLALGGLLERRPSELSGGQRRQAAIARAILAGPRLLLLDEPLTNIDSPAAGRIAVYLKRVMQVFEIPAVYVSHSISDVLYLCDEVVVLNEGRVTTQGPAYDVVTRRGVLDEAHLAELRNLFSAEQVSFDGQDGMLRCRIGSQELVAAGERPERVGPLTLSIRACDIVLASQRPVGISARNVLAGSVTRVEQVGLKFVVFVDVGQSWMVEVGRGAVAELKLAAGSRVFAIVKATAIRVL